MTGRKTEKEVPAAPATGSGGRIARLFRHSAIYSVSTSVQRLQGLILTPIYTSTVYLPQVSQYGNYGLIYTFIAFMNFVYLYGMDSAFLRYFFLGGKDQKRVFSTSFLILVFTGLITSSLLFLFADTVASLVLFTPELAPLVRLAALILYFDTLGNFPFLILRARERPVTFSIFRMLRFSLELLFNILFVVVLKKGVPGILYANLAASVLNLLIMSPFAAKYLVPALDFPLLREMSRFGLPFLPNGIAFMTLEMMDRFLVTHFLGKDIMAFYHANCKFATVLLLLIVGFRNAWQPFFLKEANKPGAGRMYSRILNYYLLVAGLVVIFILFFIRDILTAKYFGAFYLLGSRYWSGIPVIPWKVLAYFLFGIYVIFTPAFYISKKSQYMLLFTGAGALISVIANLLLLPVLQLWGAVVATLIAYLVMTGLIIIAAQRIHPMPLDRIRIGLLIFLLGTAFIWYYIWQPGLITRLGVFFVILVAATFICVEMDQIRRMAAWFGRRQGFYRNLNDEE